MIMKVVDHRKYKNTKQCDAVLEIFTTLNLSEENRVIKGFESEDIDYILNFANNLKMKVIVYLYDLNSKPLK
jgi:hypothetical protein